MKYFLTIFFLIQLLHPLKESKAGIIKIVPTQKNQTYETLSGNNKIDRDNIKQLFTLMAKYGKISILMHHKKRLERLGEEIGHVHPWIVIEEISKTQELRDSMKKIIPDPFKWHPVIKGLTSSILHEIQKNNFFQYIEEYAKIRNIPSDRIRSYIDYNNPKKTNFEKLIKALIAY